MFYISKSWSPQICIKNDVSDREHVENFKIRNKYDAIPSLISLPNSKKSNALSNSSIVPLEHDLV